MASLEEVMAYLCAKYPYKNEISKARLAKMIYLGDWRMALDHGHQMTNLEWTFNHYGPYLNEVRDQAAMSSNRFEIKRETNMYGSPKEVIALRREETKFDLTKEEADTLDAVIAATKSLNWTEFIKFVYSTYPIATQPRYQPLDLVDLAEQYKKVRPLIAG